MLFQALPPPSSSSIEKIANQQSGEGITIELLPIVGVSIPVIVRHGDLVFVSGQGAKDPATGKLAGPDAASQTRQVLKNVSSILEAAGSGLEYVVQCRVFLTDIRDFAEMNEVYSRYFSENKPARATVQAAGLPRGARVEIDCIAVL